MGPANPPTADCTAASSNKVLPSTANREMSNVPIASPGWTAASAGAARQISRQSAGHKGVFAIMNGCRPQRSIFLFRVHRGLLYLDPRTLKRERIDILIHGKDL